MWDLVCLMGRLALLLGLVGSNKVIMEEVKVETLFVKISWDVCL
jgi:hypothetical protein